MKPVRSDANIADRLAHLEWKANDIRKQRGMDAAKHYLARNGAPKEIVSRVLEGK